MSQAPLYDGDDEFTFDPVNPVTQVATRRWARNYLGMSIQDQHNILRAAIAESNGRLVDAALIRAEAGYE